MAVGKVLFYPSLFLRCGKALSEDSTVPAPTFFEMSEPCDRPQKSHHVRLSLLLWLAFSLLGLPVLGLLQAAQSWLAEQAPDTIVQTVRDNWMMLVLGAAAPLGAFESSTWLKENAPRLRGFLIGAYTLALVVVFMRILGGLALGLGLVAASQASLAQRPRWAIRVGSFLMGLVGLGLSLAVCLVLPESLGFLDTGPGVAASLIAFLTVVITAWLPLGSE